MRAKPLDVRAVRKHFDFPRLGRVVTNNAASTQPPRELLALYQSRQSDEIPAECGLLLGC